MDLERRTQDGFVIDFDHLCAIGLLFLIFWLSCSVH